MAMRCLLLSLLLWVSLGPCSVALAWGQRGHDLIARVAARVLIARLGKDKRFTAPLAQREHTLGYLANVPDVIWRNMGREVEAMNAPTHYIDLEYVAVTAPAALAVIPRTAAAMEARMTGLCAKPPSGYRCPLESPSARMAATLAGTAPLRVQQLAAAMTADFARARAADPASQAFKTAVTDALLQAGLLSHFVGDLGQPYHATVDYDGAARDAGGVHVYFESAVVDAYDLSLDQEVYQAALAGTHWARLEKTLASAGAGAGQDPLTVAYVLAVDSFSRLPEANTLDTKHAILKAGRTDHGMRLKAERRDPAEVLPYYHALIVERLATAADALSHVWLAAWEAGGRPDLSRYQDFNFPATPAFIQPD